MKPIHLQDKTVKRAFGSRPLRIGTLCGRSVPVANVARCSAADLENLAYWAMTGVLDSFSFRPFGASVVQTVPWGTMCSHCAKACVSLRSLAERLSSRAFKRVMLERELRSVK